MKAVSGRHNGRASAWIIAASALLGASGAAAQTTAAPAAALQAETLEARNFALVGRDDLQTRSAYQVVTHQRGERMFLYIGHHAGEARNPLTGKVEQNGLSILDVTDPRQPKLLAHIPPSPVPWFEGDPAMTRAGTQHVQVCAGRDLPGGKSDRVYALRNLGNIAHELLDVTDPRKVRVVKQIQVAESAYGDPVPEGLDVEGEPRIGTHKNFWECPSGIAYMPGSVAGWNAQKIFQIYDLSDPAKPRHIRDFGLADMSPAGAPRRSRSGGRGVHEVTAFGDRVYVAYGVYDNGAVQILDREKLLKGDPKSPDPMAPTRDNLLYPQIGYLDMPYYWGAHSAKPIIGMKITDYQADKKGAVRDFLVVVSEGVNHKCAKFRHLTFFLDITDPTRPFPVSNYQVPAKPAKPGGIDFCDYGVFGPHSPHASFSPLYNDRLMFLSYFSGGVRAVDIRDPFAPVEVGHFLARPTANTRIEAPTADSEISHEPHTNFVEIDPRGRYVYAADRASSGLHVLEITGEAAAIVRSRDVGQADRTPP